VLIFPLGLDGSAKWNEVGQVAVFGVVPDLLHGVEFRGIRGQPFWFKPVRVSRAQHTDRLAMDVVAVEDQNELPPKVAAQQTEEPFHLFRSDVVGMDLKVGAEPASDRRQGEGRNRRKAFSTIPASLEWRPAAGRPSPASHGLAKKTT